MACCKACAQKDGVGFGESCAAVAARVASQGKAGLASWDTVRCAKEIYVALHQQGKGGDPGHDVASWAHFWSPAMDTKYLGWSADIGNLAKMFSLKSIPDPQGLAMYFMKALGSSPDAWHIPLKAVMAATYLSRNPDPSDIEEPILILVNLGVDASKHGGIWATTLGALNILAAKDARYKLPLDVAIDAFQNGVPFQQAGGVIPVKTTEFPTGVRTEMPVGAVTSWPIVRYVRGGETYA